MRLGLASVVLFIGCFQSPVLTEPMALRVHGEFKPRGSAGVFQGVFYDEDRNAMIFRYRFASETEAYGNFSAVQNSLRTNGWQLTIVATNRLEGKFSHAKGSHQIAHVFHAENKVVFGTMWFPAPPYHAWGESKKRWIQKNFIPKLETACRE